jgi:hypothetical protein
MRQKLAVLIGLLLLVPMVGSPLSSAEKKKKELPAGVRGFSGRVRGVVVSRGRKHDFRFKVEKVQLTWKNNQAVNPEKLAGQTVTVYPNGQKNGQGELQPNELHVGFIRTLKPEQEITLELINKEGSIFSILELSKEQRRIGRGEANE